MDGAITFPRYVHCHLRLFAIFLSSCNRHLAEKIELLSRRIETSLEKSSNYYLSLQHLDETV